MFRHTSATGRIPHYRHVTHNVFGLSRNHGSSFSQDHFFLDVFGPFILIRLVAQRSQRRLPVKMWILPLVGYLGYLTGFIFLTLSIGASSHCPSSCHQMFLYPMRRRNQHAADGKE